MKRKAYIYPVTNRIRTGIYNPYLDNFMSSTFQQISYLNSKYPSNTGILNLFRFLHRIDLLMLNWIEDLPDKKGGIFQTILFLILLKVIKLTHIKIVWTLHNKFSHSSDYLTLKKRLFFQLLKSSDLIITHSAEGIRFAESLVPGISTRFFYFPHPVVPVKHEDEIEELKKYDILIWGTLAPYKAVDLFLEQLYEKKLETRFRILIAGKSVSDDFFNKIRKYENASITIKNQFIKNEELTVMIKQSKVVLFTYAGDSVLSSGALIDSVANGALVVGPDVGAFNEMGNEGIIKTYDNYEELFTILERIDQYYTLEAKEKIEKFIFSHQWKDFSKEFEKRLNNI